MDNKAIEEKAIICFKDYILDSKVISPFLNENDKEPCWDGHLYVYSDPSKSKKYLSGRVPVQIKGTIVKRFVTKKYKFSVDVSDLKAYKTEPTVYVVCQQKEHSKERMLFYRFFLPETVKNILKGKESQGSIKVLFHEMPQDVVEFENRIKVFIGDRQKQLSFVNGKPFTLDDAKRKHITSFTFLAPNANMNSMELMSYLSSHPSFLYAKVDESLEIEVPISNGPMSFLFQNTIDANISVNGKVFYNSSLSRMRLWGYVLYEKLEYFKKYNAALITLSHDELMRFYARKGDTEGLVNQPLQMKGVRFSCFFREELPGKINVSLRSVDDFPCNRVAAEFFNGGGHMNASGGELHCSMESAVEIFRNVLQKCRNELME